MRVLTPALAAAVLLTADPSDAQQPRLVVHITVDQLRPDYLSAWQHQLTGGFARFWREGAFFENGFHDHANTETAPGHASVLSGRFPYSTGIIANSRGVETHEIPLIAATDTGAGPFRFKGTTLADWMQARDPATRVLSVSRKDRSAILPVAPSRAHTVLWYSRRTGIFTTSTWYATALPAWVTAFNAERPVHKLIGRTWELLLAESEYPEPAGVPGARRENERFPHTLSTDTATALSAIADYPWIDSLTLELAWRGVRAMDLGGSNARTDLLAISLSATDGVGHRWGPDSRELHDQVLRADRYLGAFLDSLFALRGRENVVLSLTSDHGVVAVPEVRSRFDDNREARRVPSAVFRPLVAQARAALREAGLDTTAVRWEDLVLYLDRGRLGGAAFDATPMIAQFASAALGIPGVMRVDRVADLQRADTVADAIGRRWQRMFPPSGEAAPGFYALLAVTLDPHTYHGSSQDATHGSPHDYDARVPVAFLGPHFRPGRQTAKVNVVDIAPTLAAVLGVTPLERVDGRVVREAIR